ncbi:hypothetical protein [uncultured Propionibacterium sp.]|uniref:hypothetical protein n=1 Tax=uncultured Propionibacterium sp. TaxID=218066 RepID=UPI00292E0592|nr:hypothetical protein [uncultured Propionibacterium sp.]
MNTPQQPGPEDAGQNSGWANQPAQPGSGWQQGGDARPQGPANDQSTQSTQGPQTTGWQQAQPHGQPAQAQQPYGQPVAPQQPAQFTAHAAQNPAQPNPAPPRPSGPDAFPGQPGSFPGQNNAFPGQAGAAWAGAGNAFPGGPAGNATGSSTRPKSAKWIPILIGAILLVLIIVTVLIVRGGSAEDRAREAVQDYLTAISQSDADKARGYLPSSLDDDSLLTDAVLKDSNSRAPISDIAVGNAAQSSTSDGYNVPVSYTIGGESVSTTVEVHIYSGNDASIYSYTYLSLSAISGIDVKVNGVTPNSSTPYVFPGNYDVTIDNQYLTVTGGEIKSYDPGDYSADSDLDLAVSDAGIQMFREKVVAEAQACLASTKIDPGCGAKLPDHLASGEQIREDSVHRSQDTENAAKLRSVTPEPGITTPTVISAHYYDLGNMDVTATCGKDGNWAEYELYGSASGLHFGSPAIDLTDPDLKVVWDT